MDAPAPTGGEPPSAFASRERAITQAAEQDRSSAQAAVASKTTTRARNQAARANAPPPAQTQAFGTLSTTDTQDSDMPAEDVPPATVANPGVRDAWLARIRTLAKQGHGEQARASLREFVLRYPHYQLPADLRALQDGTPGGTPPDGPGTGNDTPQP